MRRKTLALAAPMLVAQVLNLLRVVGGMHPYASAILAQAQHVAGDEMAVAQPFVDIAPVGLAAQFRGCIN